MIEFDKSEYLSCAVDEVTFRLIEDLYNRQIADMLLYKPPPGVLHDITRVDMVDDRPLARPDVIGCAYLHRPKNSFKRSETHLTFG